MKTKKNLAIWMDHASADLIDLYFKKKRYSILSKFTFKVKEEALSRSENIMHNKKQQMQEAYYKKIAAEILQYDHVLLFGSTDAKLELHNYVKQDLHFKDIKIDIVSKDKITDNEKIAFVKQYFEN